MIFEKHLICVQTVKNQKYLRLGSLVVSLFEHYFNMIIKFHINKIIIDFRPNYDPVSFSKTLFRNCKLNFLFLTPLLPAFLSLAFSMFELLGANLLCDSVLSVRYLYTPDQVCFVGIKLVIRSNFSLVRFFCIYS